MDELILKLTAMLDCQYFVKMQSFISTLIFSFLISISCFAIKGGVVLTEYDELARSVVALQMVEKETSGKVNFYKGTAVLISENIALTASHNFFYLSESNIKLSSAILSTSPKWGYKLFNEKRISIKKVIMLPGFSQNSLGTQNDLALILLSESVPYYCRPLKMDFNPMPFHQSREFITVLGYGRSGESSEIFQNVVDGEVMKQQPRDDFHQVP